ncbi:DUF1684 domain-containing protein [Nakamurella lactea]|uniref:DUF1684 domain-containing protein n=1 Tax=Nakamurella lactea TaxID=459515 RepID=UPI0003F931BC|nr:DUF1684 domain-containing protein [Nakamurella lactea]
MTTTQGNIVRESSFAEDWANWRAAREFALTAEYGWLSLTAFHWLPESPGPLDGLPGTWSVTDDGARHTPPDGDPITARVAEAGSLNWFRLGDRVVELVLRGGRYAIRVRDPLAPNRVRFAGVPAFAADPAWVIAGRFQPFDDPRRITVDTARTDLQQQVTIVGTVTVQVAGADHSLLAGAGADGALTISFHDDTNGASTARWRTVATSVPDADGSLTIDFNRTVNLPFAFSDHGTCPAPPGGNRIPVEITAGEKQPQ